MIVPIPVMEFLLETVGAHKFGSHDKAHGRNNFEFVIERSVTLECSGGKRVPIPTGSTLVIYRSPQLAHVPGTTIACFHHTDGKKQTVIYAGGVGRVKELGRRTFID